MARDWRRLLPDVEMAKAADFAGAVSFGGFLFPKRRTNSIWR